MTQDEIIVLWKDANGWDVRGYKNTLEDLERFANLVAAKEREACAKVVDDWSDWHGGTKLIAAVIRERGQKSAGEGRVPLSLALAQPEQEPEYAWPTVADYERDVGFQTNEAFRMAWGMARTTNKMLGHPSPPQQEPFAWFRYQQGSRVYYDTKKWDDCQPLYTSPPQGNT